MRLKWKLSFKDLIAISLFKKIKKLSSYSLLSGIALLLGFARELIVASKFGLSSELDVFVAVMGFHLFFGVQIGNALETSFVSKVAKLGGVNHVKENLASSLYSLLIINLFIAVFLIIFSGNLIKIIFPAFTAEQNALSIKIVNYLIIAIIFANITGLMRGGLYVIHNYAPGFLSGSLISLCSIVSVTLFSEKYGIKSLLFGFVVGNLLVLILFLFYLLKRGAFSLKLNANSYNPKMFYIWSAAAVILFGEILYQAISMTERSFASTLTVGTISSFFYASTLVVVPLTLFVTPITTTLFPRMTEAFHKNKQEGIRLLKLSGTTLFLFATSIVIFLSIFANSVVKLVYVRGNFSMEDASRTAQILSIIVFALPFLSVSRLIRFSFYSLSDYRTPVYGNLLNWLILIMLGSYLVPYLGAKGLAISSVVAVSCGTFLMALLLIKKLRNG